MLTDTAIHTALNAVPLQQMSLHTGDPGPTGANNEVSGGSYSRQNCTFGTAANRKRVLSSDVLFEGLPADTTVSHYVVRNSSGVAQDIGAFENAETYTGPNGTHRINTGEIEFFPVQP